VVLQGHSFRDSFTNQHLGSKHFLAEFVQTKRRPQNENERGFQMKRRITMWIGTGLMVASLGYAQAPTPGQAPDANRPAANPQQSPNAGQGNPRGGTPSATANAAEKTVEARLTKVDTAAKTITVRKEGDTKDMTFKYNDATTVVGGDRSVQGLSGKTGSTLKITYKAENENDNMASRIEISETK